ncbi:MAG: hypothetical protein ACTSPY_02320 [Candidatus Helarchaeota archaeon]
MKIRIKIPRRNLIKEDDFKDRVKEQYLEWKEELLNKAKNVKDLKELRNIIDELGRDNFDWETTIGDWLEKSKPYEIVCIVIRLPGLKKGHERYSIYGILSFSKGMTDSFDHTGDLERLVYIKNEKGNYFSYSTVGHGYLELFPEILGNRNSFYDLIKREEYVFEVGDHSLCTERDNTKILIGRVPFIDIFRIIKSNIYKDHVFREIPLLTIEELEKKLEINWYNYATEVIKLDRFINSELKTFSKFYRLKRAIYKFRNYISKKKEIDYLYLLYAIRSTIWNISPLKQEKLIHKLKKVINKIEITQNTKSKLLEMLDSLLFRLDNLIDPVEFLKWLVRQDVKKMRKKFDIQTINEFTQSELETLPFALYKILDKPLDDIGYPERLSPIEKGKRIIFWIGGNIYRILRSQFANLGKKTSDKFKSVTNLIDRIAFKEE